jgi:hypothetical protein
LFAAKGGHAGVGEVARKHPKTRGHPCLAPRWPKASHPWRKWPSVVVAPATRVAGGHVTKAAVHGMASSALRRGARGGCDDGAWLGVSSGAVEDRAVVMLARLQASKNETERG